MIGHATWRNLIYKLAEDYPECLMLTFTVKVSAFYVTLLRILTKFFYLAHI